jgi:hypothetical protein
MDALTRLEQVGRPLLRTVDAVLDKLGAPPEHRVWSLLRRVGASPGDAVAVVAAMQPDRLRPVAAALSEQAGRYEAAALPTDLGWLGHAGTSYAVRAAALDAHLRGHGGGSLAGRLRAAAGYLDDVADWQRRSRDRMASALGDVLTSTQAMTVTRHLTGGGPGGSGPNGSGPNGSGPASYLGSGKAVQASADVGAWLLAEAAAALDEGTAVGQRWAGSLSELTFATPADSGPVAFDGTIEMRH